MTWRKPENIIFLKMKLKIERKSSHTTVTTLSIPYRFVRDAYFSAFRYCNPFFWYLPGAVTPLPRRPSLKEGPATRHV